MRVLPGCIAAARPGARDETMTLLRYAAATWAVACGADTLTKYVLVPGFDAMDAPMFSRWGVPFSWDSTYNETELVARAREFATSNHLGQTHGCVDDVDCIAGALAERMAATTRTVDADWPERLRDAVRRVGAASGGYEPSGEIAVVLSGSTDKLAATLESLYERVILPSGARVFAVLSGGGSLPDETRQALASLPFISALQFADAATDAEAVKQDHAEHFPYPTRKKKESAPHVNLLWMWKGVRDANALREQYEETAGTTHRVVARLRTDMEFDRAHDLAAYVDLEKYALYVPRCGHAVVTAAAFGAAWQLTPHAIERTQHGDNVASQVSHVAARLPGGERPVLRGAPRDLRPRGAHL